ncbi:HxlR family transcriptional regulator [Bhargavaea cecembensis]|uniref:HxlR family transcriptional regulator n=1 Tax=Bhargavaea cecembensis TaxID=394098 RepID=A0A163ETP3_9BACL|nr:helix-turn-helix domain-containing protein [Bhargavaea cecembensis]KZE37157.1 HxlR family transcriptional regulator [Bhargavaea cecembensis]
MQTCPYMEAAFQILGKKWNGQLVHYLWSRENYAAHFSEMKQDLAGMTPRALSLKLTELTEAGLIEKTVHQDPSISILYRLTDKGAALAESLKPIQEWAQQHLDVQLTPTKEEQ